MGLDHRAAAAAQHRIASIGRWQRERSADRRPAPRPFELLLFATDPVLVAEATRAGMDGVIVDWERRGKARRQAGQGTQINSDTLADLRRVRATTDVTVICRLNGFGWWTPREVDQAIDAGADELLLPMVRNTDEVDRTLECVADRCGLGILVETSQGVRATPELVTRPLSRVYVGLNDLRIDRGSDNLFQPLVDGTVEQIRAHVGGLPFGVAGLTVPDRGAPVPSRLLAAELTRIGAGFTFLRRSFLADTGGRQLVPAVSSIRADLSRLAARTAAQELADRWALEGLVSRSAVQPA
jgi:2-keto-3-deoxy-L-rhamnonate aldolase RhmA